MTKKNFNKNISVIGLGYVGLPLAIEFSKKFNVIGFDLNKNRIEELINCVDRTSEISKEELKKQTLSLLFRRRSSKQTLYCYSSNTS